MKTKEVITISTYIHFTKEQREQARRTDLANFLISQGEKVKKSGSEYEWIDGSQRLQSEATYGIISTNKKAVMRLISFANFTTRTMPKRFKCF